MSIDLFPDDIRSREELLDAIKSSRCALEIGPFDRPVLADLPSHGCEVYYADYLSSDELRERASLTEGRNPESVPHIEYVLRDQPLDQISRKFDAVASFHCAEHQPDFIKHLQDAMSLLEDDGKYYCVLPDKGKCFDYYIPVSVLPEMLAAFYERRTRPSLRSVIEHRAFTCQDFMDRPPNPFVEPDEGVRERIGHAVIEHEAYDYVDVHCWYFTEQSVGEAIQGLRRLGYLPPTTRHRVYSIGAAEFLLVLSR